MPELPEVEIVGRNLRRWALGKRLVEVEILAEGSCKGSQELVLRAGGQVVTDIRRRGKVLWLETDGPVGWLMYFGMTGKWVQVPHVLPDHARLAVTLEDGTRLCFQDMRRFGGILGLPVSHGLAALHARAPGRDPLLEGLEGTWMHTKLAGKKGPIKPLLLDQHWLAGVGNIYASESLFRAGIHPATPAGALDLAGCERLAEAILAVLTWAVEVEERDELRYFGEGGVDNIFRVYAREGQPCPACATPIQRLIQAQRSSFCCPICQPLST